MLAARSGNPQRELYSTPPASHDEAGGSYAQTPDQDEALGAIGHVRMDFGQSGKGFWHTWWPREAEELNFPEFKTELGNVIDKLRKTVLKDLPSMRTYCRANGGAIYGEACTQNYGYTVETERYVYRLRCDPTEGDYNAYLSCFDKQTQELAQVQTNEMATRRNVDEHRIKGMAGIYAPAVSRGQPDLASGDGRQ